jgi:antitoxin VapB
MKACDFHSKKHRQAGFPLLLSLAPERYIFNGIYLLDVTTMLQTAKIFTNGRSQAVRLPKAFRFDTEEVYIRRVGNDVILSANKPCWRDFFQETSAFGDDFLAERDNAPPQEREAF